MHLSLMSIASTAGTPLYPPPPPATHRHPPLPTTPSSQAVNTYEGTHDVHALIVGRGITGIPAFVPGAALAK